jgi:hypothetical protein
MTVAPIQTLPYCKRYEHDLREAQVAARESYRRDLYDLHYRQGLNVALLVSVLWDLKAVQCPRINLDLLSYRADLYGVSRAPLKKSKAITHPILNAVLCSDCPISGLRLGSDDFLDPGLLGITQISTLRNLGKALQSYRFVLNTNHLIELFGNANDGGSTRADQWRVMTTALLASAEELQVLYLKGGAYHKLAPEGVLCFTSVILEANQLSCLQELTILGTHCSPNLLLGALERSSGSLRGLALRRVVFTSPGLLWLTLFEQILKCSRLEVLSIESLYDDHRDDRCRMEVRNHCEQLQAQGRDMVRAALINNVAHFAKLPD